MIMYFCQSLKQQTARSDGHISVLCTYDVSLHYPASQCDYQVTDGAAKEIKSFVMATTFIEIQNIHCRFLKEICNDAVILKAMLLTLVSFQYIICVVNVLICTYKYVISPTRSSPTSDTTHVDRIVFKEIIPFLSNPCYTFNII